MSPFKGIGCHPDFDDAAEEDGGPSRTDPARPGGRRRKGKGRGRKKGKAGGCGKVVTVVTVLALLLMAACWAI